MMLLSPMNPATKRSGLVVDVDRRPICWITPSFITMMVSDIVSASSWSWVT
jgi:hypothetical protein